MKQGWKSRALAAAVAACVAAAPVALPAAVHAAAAKSAAAKSAKSKYAFKQFTGYVTALDKQNLTVEKRGKNAATRVFEKHGEMKTMGNLEKDAHVTVYYREEGGRVVAHKVVVKADEDGNDGGR